MGVQIMGIVGLILEGLDWNWRLLQTLFFFVSGLLVLFSLSLLTITISIYLRYKEKVQYLILRILLFFYVVLTSIFSIEGMKSMFKLAEPTLLETVTIIFGVIGPICIIIVGRFLLQLKIFGHKIFNHYVLWGVYLIIATFWELLYPSEIYYGFVLVYTLINVVLLHYCLAKDYRRVKI